MPTLFIISRDGSRREVQVREGQSLMQALRDGGSGELLAICGGGCSCATCHVHVDPDFIDRLPPIGADEDDLLDSSIHRATGSRLSCQVPVTAALDGMTVRIAQED